MPSDGVIESQLVWSHDGETWHHFDEERTPAIGRSKDGFDSGKTHDDCWHLGCILPRVPAMIVRTGMVIGTAKEPVVDEEAVRRTIIAADMGFQESQQ